MREPIHCPECEEPVQPIVTDDVGFRCPVCQYILNEIVTRVY